MIWFNRVQWSRLLRSQAGASSNLPNVPSPPYWTTGVIGVNNGNGICSVYLGGSPTPVNLPYLNSYTPQQGDRVRVLRDKGGGEIHGAYASQAQKAVPSNVIPLTPIYANMAVSSNLVGVAPAPNMPCVLSAGDVMVTTNGSGVFSFTFPHGFTYTAGYSCMIAAGGTGQGFVVPVFGSCTLSSVTGWSYTVAGALNASSAIVVAYQLIGA
jgi:hypothetical protein